MATWQTTKFLNDASAARQLLNLPPRKYTIPQSSPEGTTYNLPKKDNKVSASPVFDPLLSTDPPDFPEQRKHNISTNNNILLQDSIKTSKLSTIDIDGL